MASDVDLRVEVLAVTIRRLERENERLERDLALTRRVGFNAGFNQARKLGERETKQAQRKARREQEDCHRAQLNAERESQQMLMARGRAEVALLTLLCDALDGVIEARVGQEVITILAASRQSWIGEFIRERNLSQVVEGIDLK
jgi:hypothetical protein